MKPQEAELMLIRSDGTMPQLVLKSCGVEQVWNLRPTQLRQIAVEAVKIALSGSTGSRLGKSATGKPLDGELSPQNPTITVNTRYLRNGVGKVPQSSPDGGWLQDRARPPMKP